MLPSVDMCPQHCGTYMLKLRTETARREVMEGAGLTKELEVLKTTTRYLSVRSVDRGEGEVTVARAQVDRERTTSSHTAPIEVEQGSVSKLRVMTMNESRECRLFVTNGALKVGYRYTEVDGSKVELLDCGPKVVKMYARGCSQACTGHCAGAGELNVNVPNLRLEVDCACYHEQRSNLI